ncbi:MAG TPA: CopD family protein [Nitrospirota bacterium]|nr:CopD family protein [Nitrospirota bacterium]
MKELIIACYWIHLVATVIWIGGITFIIFIAIPSSKQVLGAESGKLMGEISKRFTPLANYSIILLFVSGIVLAGLNKQFSGVRVLESNWTMALILKLVLFFSMTAIHFYRGLVLAPKIMRTATQTEKTALQKLSINLVKVNFALGLSVLLLSGAIPVLRGF